MIDENSKSDEEKIISILNQSLSSNNYPGMVTSIALQQVKSSFSAIKAKEFKIDADLNTILTLNPGTFDEYIVINKPRRRKLK